jgi:type IV pilus assembly protein PilE
MHMPKRIISRKPDSAGFTLIELMVVVIIASVLISIAIPTYISSVRKSRRTEAKTALLDLAGREERFYNTSNTYSNTPSDLGYGAGAAPFSMIVGNGYYLVTIAFTAFIPGPPSVAATYTITATPVVGSDQAKDAQCTQFQLTNTGLLSSTPNTTVCWQ